tara:strand:- start:50 stop:820 length:771 start_codon:yes stop_codon:yes gene_type:complete
MAGGTSFERITEGQMSPLFPFGPMMMHAKLPMSMVRQLNKYTNKIIKDEKKAKKLDHSDNLVGKLKQEILIEQKELNKHIDTFNNIIANFLQTDMARHFKQIEQGTGFAIDYKSAWVVRQFANEFNPAHVHTQCDMSCVGYLKLPPEIDKEWEEDYKDHYPCKGHIEFLHGQPGKMHMHTFLVKPTVGDFFVFPADLIHTVYPFKSEGERRSFSMNITVAQQKLDENGKPIEAVPYAMNENVDPKAAHWELDSLNK